MDLFQKFLDLGAGVGAPHVENLGPATWKSDICAGKSVARKYVKGGDICC